MDKEIQIVQTLLFENNENVFLSGVGGTGKSTVLKQIYKMAKERNINVEICGTTGIASFNVGGITIHKWAGVHTGDQDVEKLISNIYKYKLHEAWEKIELLMIDEISMLGAGLFEKLDIIGRRIRKVDEPFGGIQLLVSGDFCQLPPVNDDFVFETDVWDSLDFTTFELRHPFRYSDKEYFNMLLRIRKGKQTVADISVLKSRLVRPSEDMVTTYLYATRNLVDKKNKEELAKLKSEVVEYKAVDTIESAKFFLKKKHEIDTSKYFKDIIPDTLSLKNGAKVILIKNLDVRSGLMNGAQGKILKCEKETVQVEFSDQKEGKLIKTIGFEKFEMRDRNFKVTRLQIPLLVGFCLTIHRCQSLTLESCVVNLGKSIFCPGAAYVALSRCKTLSGLYLSDFVESSLYADKKALAFENSFEEEKIDV